MTSWTPPALPARLAASRQLPLVGRRGELATMEAVWGDVTAARRQVVLVGGEPGAGKSRLLAEIAGALHDAGVAVLVGACAADTGVPYQPFTEILDHLFAGTPEGALTTAVGERAGQLARLSGHVRRHNSGPLEADDAGDARRHLFDAVAALLRSLAAERPVALILDDLHWAPLPTVALLEHVVEECAASPILVVAAFRTTAPDRSGELAERVAALHRLDGVRRLDLRGLDTDAIAEYLADRTGMPLGETRVPAALLRDRTGGNPFFLRELWADLQRRGGLAALRAPATVPASVGDTLAARLRRLDPEVRELIELAAVLGATFDLPTLMAAGEHGHSGTLPLLDRALEAGLIEPDASGPDRYSFVHALTRQAVLDRLPHARRAELHARAAAALEQQPPHDSLTPRIAHHYLACHVLGFHERALCHSREAARLAERSLAFEEAAVWLERAAALPACEPATRAELLVAAAGNYVRACHFPRARAIYDRLVASAVPGVQLAAAVGLEDASWRPGVLGSRAADVLSNALAECGLDERDPRYVRGLGSLARALALAGETTRAREVTARAVALADAGSDETTRLHVLATAMWHGTTPEVADAQRQRTATVRRMAEERQDHEVLGASANFAATVSYLVGRPEGLRQALEDARRAVQATGQPYYRHVYCCVAHTAAFLRGDFAAAREWADEALKHGDSSRDEMTEGPHGVQMYMLARETGSLDRFRPYLNGSESFEGRWVPGLLALYTELGVDTGVRRALRYLTGSRLSARTNDAQWPMELVFLTEAALMMRDVTVARMLQPLLDQYAGRNLTSGTLIATFGSADRYRARLAAFLGRRAEAERHFAEALEMDRRMSVVHTGETLAHYAAFVRADGRAARGAQLADQAREEAEAVGHERVLRLLALRDGSSLPDGLTQREADVLRLLAGGLSNQEIGARLHISANTAANHIRSILMKTGAANRTQAAMYAAQHELV